MPTQRMSQLVSESDHLNRPEHARTALALIIQRFKPHVERKVDNSYTQRSQVSLYSDEKIDVEDILSNELTAALKNISPSPEWLDIQAAMKYWKNSFDEFMRESSLMTVFEEMYSTTLSYDQQINLFVNANTLLQKYLVESYDEWQEASITEFLNSDLPFELYNMYSLSYINKIAALRQIENLFQTFRTIIHINRNNSKKLNRAFAQYKNQFSDINEQILLSSRSELVIRLFLKCISGKNTEDLFNAIPVTLNGHTKEFDSHFTAFKNNVFNLTQFLSTDLSKYGSLLDPTVFENFKNGMQGIVLNGD